MSSDGSLTSTLGSPPSAGLTQMSPVASRVRASNAIHLPSGDQVGEPAVPPSLLKIAWPSVIAAFQSQIAHRVFRYELVRMRLPSGEILGEYSSDVVSMIFSGAFFSE